MKKGLTELVMILDRSGSMSGLEADTIGGFNGMIEKQKKEDGEAYVSVILFDDQSEVIYDRVDIGKVEPMTDNNGFNHRRPYIVSIRTYNHSFHSARPRVLPPWQMADNYF